MQKGTPVKGKYVATVEELLVGSAPQRAAGFWDEFFLLEPRAQWLHSTLLSATCARHATAVQPWLRDLLRAAVDATAAATTAAPAKDDTAFGADLAWTRAAYALTDAAVALQAVCAATLRATPGATLALVLGDGGADDGSSAAGRATAETLLALVHAAHAVLVHTSVTASTTTTLCAAKTAAARLLAVMLDLANPQQQDQSHQDQEGDNVFRESLRAVDVSSAAWALLRETGAAATAQQDGPAQEAALELLALTFAVRQGLTSTATTATLDIDDSGLDACVAVLGREAAATVDECARACAGAARAGWGVRWLGARAAGWLCGAAPPGVPPANLRLAPCLLVLRALCTHSPRAAARLFDTHPPSQQQSEGPLPTRLFGSPAAATASPQKKEEGPQLRHGVLRALVELLSLCLAGAESGADFVYACGADAALDTVLAIVSPAAGGSDSERAAVLERVGDLSLAFDADVFYVPSADSIGSGGGLARERRRGCLVDHVLRLAAAHLARPRARALAQLQLKCVCAVHCLAALCCFETGPDARVRVDWCALFLSVLRVLRHADHALRRPTSPDSEAVACEEDAGLERAQTLAIAREALGLVAEGLCLGDAFAGAAAAERLWYEVMRLGDRVPALLRALEPEVVVNGDTADAAGVDDGAMPALDARVSDVLAQAAALLADRVAQAQRSSSGAGGADPLDASAAAQLAEGARKHFLARESTAAAAAQRQAELRTLFAQCRTQEPHGRDPVDARYGRTLCSAVQCHARRVFQPVDQ